MDTASVQPGQEWPRRIEDAIRGCSVMLVVIGPSWLDARSARGGRRIDDPRDWVRREIEAGLRRSDPAIVPVLLEGAKMPPAATLPETLRPLTDHQAVALTRDHLKSEIEDLIESIDQSRNRDYAARALHDRGGGVVHGAPGGGANASDAERSTESVPASHRAEDSTGRTNARRSS